MAGEPVELTDRQGRVIGIAPAEFWDKLAQHPDVIAYTEALRPVNGRHHWPRLEGPVP